MTPVSVRVESRNEKVFRTYHEYEFDEYVEHHRVIVRIGGLDFRADAGSRAAAIELARKTAEALGLGSYSGSGELPA